jgi:hypothetical protein
MRTPDRQLLCKTCGRLVPLDERGRFRTHAANIEYISNATVGRGWCKASGTQAVPAPARPAGPPPGRYPGGRR